MDTNASFDIQMNQVQAQKSSDLKKRVTGTATGVATIAVVTCITLLIVNSGAQRESSSEQLQIINPNQNLRTDFFLEKGQFKQFMTLQKHNMAFFENIGEHIYNFFQPDQKQLDRVNDLLVQYLFDLIDSNDNNIVDRPEWMAFFGAVFPQDTEYFGKLYNEVNTKFPFKVDVFKKFLQNKEKESTDTPQLKTNGKVAANNFGKLIIKDNNNYKKTYTFIFNLFDINGDKAVTKSEYIKFVTSFGQPQSKAEEDAGKLFAFAQQNKFSDGNTIKFADWANFAEAIKKPLQDLLNKQSTFIQNQQLKQQQFLEVFSGHSDYIYQTTIDHINDKLALYVSGNAQWNPEQQRVLDHLVNTIVDYEFDLIDADDNKIMTRKEFLTFIHQIFKKQADRQHFYNKFDEINGGQQVTLEQFRAHIKKEINEADNDDDSSEDVEDLEYKPHESGKKIGKRLATFLVTNDRNYELTYNFFFDLFDLNSDDVVSSSEVVGIFKTFNVPQEQLEKIQHNVDKVFETLKNQGVGDGEKVTLAQWTDFAKKIRPELIKQLNKRTFFLNTVARINA